MQGIDESYSRHIDFERVSEIPAHLEKPETIDAWRHVRKYEMLRPLVQSDLNRSWLTVGDTGADAYALQQIGARKITASSISDVQLLRVKAQGFLEGIELRAVNAEQSGWEDGSVDYVLCKEAYHHFPRPNLAFYELLRIARRAVIFIEPSEGDFRLLDELRIIVKKLLRGQERSFQLFESSGNFLYRLNTKEVIKMATALQLPCLAYRYFNDFYYAPLANALVRQDLQMRIERLGIAAQDLMSRLRLMNWGLVTCIVFKEQPSQEELDELRKAGFTIHDVPRNPYFAQEPSQAPVDV